MKAIITLLAAASFAALNSSAAQSQANPPGIKLDHYHCYRVSPVTRFRPLRVRLVDQFAGYSPPSYASNSSARRPRKTASRSRTRKTTSSATR